MSKSANLTKSHQISSPPIAGIHPNTHVLYRCIATTTTDPEIPVIFPGATEEKFLLPPRVRGVHFTGLGARGTGVMGGLYGWPGETVAILHPGDI